MTRDLDPYPSYRSTGSPDFPEIPNHWSFARLRQFCSFNPSKSEAQEEIRNGNSATFLPMEAVSSTGDIRVTDMRPASDLAQGFTYFRRNDVLVAKITPCYENGKGAFLNRLPTEIGFGSTEFIVLRAGPGLDAEYLYLLTMTPQFRERGAISMTGSAGQQRVPLDFVRNYEVPLPPLEEQERIARFAKYANSRFARLIRNKRRLIALLNEEKQAIIQQAVTRGFDADAPMKPSGVAWLGEIPAHWMLVPLRQLAAIQTGITMGKDYGAQSLESRPYLRVANVQDGHLDLGTITTVRVPRSEIFRSELQPGDVLMTEGGDIDKLGRGTVWKGEIPGCLHQYHVFAVRPNANRLNAEYLAALTASQYGRAYFEATAKRTTNLASTNSTTLGRFPLPLPPVHEQEAILTELGLATQTVDYTIERTNREIDLIREYRTRLIADVVTGQIDVREAAASLPEIEIEEAGALLSEADEGDEAADLGDEGDESESADAAD
jgi:type I restriction enzyme S subunit